MPPPDSRAPAPPAAPHTDDELTRARRRPHLLLELVLAAPERLAADAELGASAGALVGLLLLASTLFALPYGCVLGWSACWKVATLFLGSTLLCIPSLHVFATFLGLPLKLRQTLVLALALPAAAAAFTFGFAPILAFLRFTMSASHVVPWRALSEMLLAVALLAGIGQLWRCMARAASLRPLRRLPLLLLGWHAVLLFVVVRMGDVLGLAE